MLKNQKLWLKLAVGFSIPTLLVLCIAALTMQIASDSLRTNDRIERDTIVVADVSRRMQFDIVQVQQFLTDISATRGQDGLDDGFEKAQAAASFQRGVSRLKEIFSRRGDRATVSQLTSIDETFADYYAAASVCGIAPSCEC